MTLPMQDRLSLLRFEAGIGIGKLGRAPLNSTISHGAYIRPTSSSVCNVHRKLIVAVYKIRRTAKKGIYNAKKYTAYTTSQNNKRNPKSTLFSVVLRIQRQAVQARRYLCAESDDRLCVVDDLLEHLVT